MNKVIVIVGPTASGKTNLSVKLAKLLDGEIINGDAMQVYKGLDILTAKIKEKEMENIPHHLFSFIDLTKNYSVLEYKEDVTKTIKDIQKRGKLPIIVGGTGLYIKAALYDYHFEKQMIPNQVIEEKYANFSNQELYDYLMSIDSESAFKTHPNNRRRVLRAIQIYETIGKTKTDINKSQNHELLYDCLFIGIDIDKDLLNTKISDRVEDMFQNNVIEEVKKQESGTTASAAIGYKQIMSYLNKEITIDECKEDIKLRTRQYSKRQMTWLKHQFVVNWFLNDDNIVYNVHTFIMRWLKNDS